MWNRALITFLGLLTAAWTARAAEPVGNGDGILHLGGNGYATLSHTAFQSFNAQSSFTVEVALNIDANSAGGRWPILLGKKRSAVSTDAGFALSINQGQFKTVGQQIHAIVADGSQQAALTSRFSQGTVHAVMTWDAGTKTLRLYINGGLEGSTSNAALGSMLNTESFKLGGPSTYGQTLQRDVLLARVWNRALAEQEVSAIWTQLDTSAIRSLPTGVGNTALVSEWLMNGLSDSTHLADSRGLNHLQLQGAATLWQGNGPLALRFPANDATGVSKSVVLQAAGGADNLAGTAVRPLKYQFEIDEVDTFSSPALKRSAWLPGYAAWKPVLKPSTRYYWRVRVQDASGKLVMTTFSPTSRFTTRAASTWYVRPGVYSTFDPNTGTPVPTSAVYGLQNGASYDNAWNGLFSVHWGEGGVEPGDTLYICGTHLYTASNANFLASQALVHISESGHSAAHPITIRMDYSNDPGALWSAMRNQINGGGTWSGPDSNGVYSSSDLRFAADYWANGSSIQVLDRESATTWQGHLGASYFANGLWYVKTPDGSHPSGTMSASGMGYRLHLGRSNFIKFLNCRFRGGTPLKDTADWNPVYDTRSPLPLSSHITFDGCDLRFGSEITLTPGHDFWTIKNSELAYSPYGIYTVLNKRAIGANYLTVQGNYIHDMGTPRFPHQDAHAVGVQGGEGHLIEGNRIEDTGSAIEFWTSSQPMRNHTVQFNFIKNIHVMPVTGGGGIIISGDNATAVTGLRTGFKIYGNIIMNTGLGATSTWQGSGIGSNNRDSMDICHNVVYRAVNGIVLSVVDAPAQGRIANNIILKPSASHLKMIGSTTSPDRFVDYNFYDATSSSSSSINIYPVITHDQHSLFGDPLLVSSSPSVPSDFRLQSTSKALKAGLSVGVTRDFSGTAIPQTATPDIGAFYHSGSEPPPATEEPPPSSEPAPSPQPPAAPTGLHVVQ